MNSKIRIIVAVAVFGLAVVALWRMFPRQPSEPRVPVAAKFSSAAPVEIAKAPVKTFPAADPTTTVIQHPTAAIISALVQGVPATAGSNPPAATNGSSPAVAEPVPVPASPSPADSQVGNTLSTQRMYLAHAPLRVPEVADPDSAGNRQVLQTMLTKALAQPATPAPSKATN